MTINTISGGTGQILASEDGQVWVLGAGETRTASAASGSFFTNGHAGVTLHIAGTLVSTGGEITIGAADHGFSCVITPTGKVISEGAGGNAIFPLAPDVSLVNAGLILSRAGGDVPVSIGGEDSSFVNAGKVRAVSDAAVQISDGTMVNEGVIVGAFQGVLGLAGNSVITNNGAIRGQTVGVQLVTSLGASTTLINRGLVKSASADAVLGGIGTDIVLNAGRLVGNVHLGAGSDRLDDRGGTVTGKIDMGEGGDSFLSGAGRQVVTLAAGNDRASMGGGADKVLGGPGNDIEIGGGGGDELIGGDGGDFLRGGGGADRLRGGAGSDTLAGGRGNDRLAGGPDADLFVFSRHEGADRIADFEPGEDRIDLDSFDIGFGALHHATHMVRGSAMIDLSALGGHGTLTLVGIAWADLDAGDFFL